MEVTYEPVVEIIGVHFIGKFSDVEFLGIVFAAQGIRTVRNRLLSTLSAQELATLRVPLLFVKVRVLTSEMLGPKKYLLIDRSSFPIDARGLVEPVDGRHVVYDIFGHVFIVLLENLFPRNNFPFHIDIFFPVCGKTANCGRITPRSFFAFGIGRLVALAHVRKLKVSTFDRVYKFFLFLGWYTSTATAERHIAIVIRAGPFDHPLLDN
jgi:hypothetical protein